jgi:molybdopterin-containing oxidoreductase family iron-sulfur binding subunit
MTRDTLLWRSIGDDGFPGDAGGEAGWGPIHVTRRDFLKLAAASAALASAGCRGPVEEIVPRVVARDAPASVPRFFATAMTLGGYATGILVESNDGRPTKIEGNPSHPASLGGSGVFEQAAILQLWDPSRSRAITRRGQPATRGALESALRAALATKPGGEGLRILMRRSSSPTLAAQLAELSKACPALQVHTWDPLHRDHSLAGARLAFGRAVEPVYRFGNADLVVALDADFLGAGPGHLRYARDFIARRKPADAKSMSRLYAVEATPTLAGAMADHRLALAPPALEAWLARLADVLRGGSHGNLPLIEAVAKDVAAHRGRCLFVAGESLSPQAHALVHRLNAESAAVGRTLHYVEPVAGDADCTQSIQALARDIDAGRVHTLLMLGGNPVYDAPADVPLAAMSKRCAFTLHLAPSHDETSAACEWHVPETHFLEHWSDARAFDGTASVVQPVVAPLYGGISVHEVLAMMTGVAAGSARDRVREQWGAGGAGDFEHYWRELLRAGVVEGTAAPPVAVQAREVTLSPPPHSPWTLVFREDASVRDGELADNAWLQELPRPHSKLVWDNAAYVSPRSAAALGERSGETLEITVGAQRIRAPVWILPGQADGAITLPLGYGRAQAAAIGRGVGFDAYPLRSADAPWSRAADSVRRVEGRHDFATTQNHARMEDREPVRRVRLEELVSGAVRFDNAPPAESLYPEWRYDSYRWAMVVDLTACIGCNACTIACQAENNIPTVGKEEVARGREMHWIRVDRYYEGPDDAPRTHFQPVPCMHCENAPCEPVCPVGATVHDSEGLNVQVYNRCVGTRFCSNNCPYKVRRFNFLQYSGRDGAPPLVARNPQVTVRMRGVMEKCNYCLQRITRARIEAEREGRRIADGDVVTACQAACPTRAITFGDLSHLDSEVSVAKRSTLDYTLLRELNTRPRTSYHARVWNPSPAVKDA